MLGTFRILCTAYILSKASGQLQKVLKNTLGRQSVIRSTFLADCTPINFPPAMRIPSLLVLISAVSLVSAGDICTYTSRSCIGSFGCCNGIAQNTCCDWPSNFGWSVKFQNMPMTSTWFGKTFGTSTCSTQTGGGGSSSGSICKNHKTFRTCPRF